MGLLTRRGKISIYSPNHSDGKNNPQNKGTNRKKGYKQRKTYQGRLNLAEVLKSLESDLEIKATSTATETRE
jgi:hypothetical protein